VTGARFTGFGDIAAATLNPPSVSADGSVVFKARLDRAGTPIDGVFRWTGSTLATVGLSAPDPDNLAITADDVGPYALDRWAAGPAARAYLLARHKTRSAIPVARLFEHRETGLIPLVVPGLTPVAGATPSPVTDLSDFVLNRAGSLFINARNGDSAGVLSLGPTGLAALALKGQPIPRSSDGSDAPGHVFEGSFSLLPDTAQRDLIFEAGVLKTGTDKPVKRGRFRLDPTGVVLTDIVEGLGMAGARDLQLDTLATSLTSQSVNGATVTAFLSGGRWSIVRTRVSVSPQGKLTVTPVIVAREGQALTGAGRIVTLDPGPVLSLPAGHGPVFALNQDGDVSFLASDGLRWGVYLFSDTGR
jgi:hypothetical protein